MKEKIAEAICPSAGMGRKCSECDVKCQYKFEIDRILVLIEQEQKPMIEALVVAKAELTIWLDCLDCDCPAEGHICGRPRVEQSLAQIDAALKEGSHE